MGLYLNSDDNGFKDTLASEIYVDKSSLIEYTNKSLGTNRKYICVSRPRRFGKTTAAEMLISYYSIACDSHALFDNLSISRSETYKTHLNKYNVLFLNITDFLDISQNGGDLNSLLKKRITRDLKSEFGKVIDEENLLTENMTLAYKHTNRRFVVIIDEWDCVFREKRFDVDSQKEYLDFLRKLLKDKSYIALVYMTGILPIKKYGVHSALNMFDEFSMTGMRSLAPYTGFTEAEVKFLCDKYNINFYEMERWYNGYLIEHNHIYNPKSVIDAITFNTFDNYWTKTEIYDALKYYIDFNIEGLKDDVIRLISGQRIKINPLRFANDMTTFKSKDDIFTLLVHLGYLGFDSNTREVFVPNEEIKIEFANAVEGSEWGNIAKAIEQSDNLLEATLALDETSVAQYIDIAHSSNTSILKYNDENSLSCVIAIAYYTASKFYKIVRELPTGKGFADMVFIPRKNINKPALLIELKWDDNADSALKQIKNKNYTGALDEYKGNILLVGINYDKTNKKHICKIEKG